MNVEFIRENYPELLLMDGYDDCIIGISHRFGREPIVAYDYGKVIDKLMLDGMSIEEAIEYFEFNQLGSYVGEHTPSFIETSD